MASTLGRVTSRRNPKFALRLRGTVLRCDAKSAAENPFDRASSLSFQHAPESGKAICNPRPSESAAAGVSLGWKRMLRASAVLMMPVGVMCQCGGHEPEGSAVGERPNREKGRFRHGGHSRVLRRSGSLPRSIRVMMSVGRLARLQTGSPRDPGSAMPAMAGAESGSCRIALPATSAREPQTPTDSWKTRCRAP